MDLLQAVLQAQGGGAVNQLAKNFGLNPGQAQSAIEHLLPALAGGMAKNAASPQGLDGLLGALTGGGHGKYLDNLGSLGSPDTVRDGNGILGHILGSKDMSRQVAAQAAAQTGIGADILKKMLPVLATMAMGALAKQSLGGGRMPAGLPGGMPGAVRPGASGDALGGVLGSMLDHNKDGSIADDVMGMLGKFLR